MQARTGISERRACQLIGLSRSVLRYQPRASVQNTELQAQLVELAQERRRFGYRRLHILLRRAGVQVNHKRIYRLYRAAGLMVKRRRRRHGVAVERERLSLPSAPNQVWSMDFVFDALSTGRRIKCLTVVDDFTKESVGILVEHGISGFRVTRALDEMVRFRGYPKAIRTDQGPEFTGKALDQWAYQRDIKLSLVSPRRMPSSSRSTVSSGTNASMSTGSVRWPKRESASRPGGGITTNTDRTARLAISPQQNLLQVGELASSS